MAVKRTAKKQKVDKPPVALVADPPGNAETAAVLRLPADCRLGAQDALKAQLQEALNGGEIVVEVAQLERVDTAALQLLALFRRELEQRGGTLIWRGTNAILGDAAGLLGLEQLLNLPAATPV